MKSEKVTLAQVELAIFAAIKARDVGKLKTIINVFYDAFLQITKEHTVLIDCFKEHSVDCFKYIVESVVYPTKTQELDRLENYLTGAISANGTTLVSMQLSVNDFTAGHILMIEVLDEETAKEIITKLLVGGLKPTITKFTFAVFLQAQSTTPLDYLLLAKSSIEKELCLKLIASEG